MEKDSLFFIEPVKHFFVFLLMALHMPVIAQERENELSAVYEQQLENQAEREEAETEDDAWWQQLLYYRKHPLNINTAGEDELAALQMLSGIQVINFLHYRKLLGKLVSVYELQAVPGWDLQTIRNILPYITVTNREQAIESLQKRLQGGEKTLLVRVSEVLERSKGFRKSETGRPYPGSRAKIFTRYRYNYKNLLQYGFTGDKDAGEYFFKSPQTMGFDFYSLHFFMRKVGKVQALALGDFTVNMAQGLIQWQSLAFKKSAAVVSVKRQSPVLKPYTAAGEFNFFRGAGITVQHHSWLITAFGSLRNLSAGIIADSSGGNNLVSSIKTSGYHRTLSEMEGRHALQNFTTGGAVQLKRSNWHIGFNVINHVFSKPFAGPAEPYAVFNISGNRWSNYSVDYSGTFRNLHFFGEAATDKKGNSAFVQGLLISADRRVDLAFVYRSVSSAYRSVFGNAFTENSMPSNEKGLYAGISARPSDHWKIDVYADFFRFPWLKYRVDAPSYGHEYMVQVTYTPAKQVELYSRYREEQKTINVSNTNMTVHVPRQAKRVNWRTQAGITVNRSIVIVSRVDLLWFDNGTGINRESGYLWFGDFRYKPLQENYSVAMRFQYFETGSYNSRIYAYENSGLYSFSIPAFFNKGFRYFIHFNYRFAGKLPGLSGCRAGLFFGQTVYDGPGFIGSGADEIDGNRKSEIKIQFFATMHSNKYKK